MNKLRDRIELSKKLKKYLIKDDIIEITNWKDINGEKMNFKWKIISVSIGNGLTENYDFFYYKDIKSNIKLYKTFNSLSCFLLNCDKYEFDI